ncbi:MAG: hypothetical protein KAJ39_06265 [Gammaproteobacteria bacterium]|nr:hypothetical protein [Gammaproteobacteria bacterium]
MEDVFGDVMRDVFHELRPDVVFADEFPEAIKSLNDMSPHSVMKGLIKDFMTTRKK